MNIKKHCLDLIEEGRYQEYLNDKESNKVVYEKVYHNPTGFIYVKDNDDNYGIRLSFLNKITDYDVLYEDIKEYLESDRDIIYLFLNGLRIEGVEYFYAKNFKEHFSAFIMELKRDEYQELENPGLELVPYKNEHFDLYIDVLGKAFYKMREGLDLKPYDWYVHNKLEADKQFQNLKEKESIFGYFVNDELIGVLLLEDEWLDTIAVKEKYQGQGLGKKLLIHGMNYIFNVSKKERIILGVVSTNEKAADMYINKGFKYKTKMTVLHKRSLR